MASGSGSGTGTSSTGGSVVVVTGAGGALGRQVCALAAADPSVARVVELDLGDTDLKRVVEGADVLVHLAQGEDGRLAQRVLEAASAVGIEHVVLLSSAVTYGAWANNPVPLTEDAPLRPNPGVEFAAEKAELERVAAEWRDDHPGATVAVLRPTLTVGDEATGWLTRALTRATPIPLTEDEPPAQLLELADLASAVDLARRARLDGPRNVAPDGWVDGDTARALAGGSARLRVPERLAVRLAGWRWRWGASPTPPALLPYTVFPWVVANDRLRADGWAPSTTNEEAFVAGHRAGPWATLSPRRRQEIALGATGVALAGAVVGVITAIRRRRRRAAS